MTRWPEQLATLVNEELTFDNDGVAIVYQQDNSGHDCYRVILRNGVISTVSSAHLVEERKLQLLRAYPLTPQ